MVMMTLTALLVVPGLLVGLAAQLPLRLAVGTSLPVSFGIAAIASYAYGRMGVTWSLGGYAVATAAAAAVVGVIGLLLTGTAWVWRRARRRIRRGARGGTRGGEQAREPARVERRRSWW